MVVVTTVAGVICNDHVVAGIPKIMNLKLLQQFFKPEAPVKPETVVVLEPVVTEAASTTGTVLTLPSGITKDLAKMLVDELAFEPIVSNVAVILAKEIGNKLTASSLRPADYDDILDIPDGLIERLIEELAKKPELFFKIFKDNLKLQG